MKYTITHTVKHNKIHNMNCTHGTHQSHSVHVATIFLRIKFDSTLTELSAVTAFICVMQSPDRVGD